MNEEYNSFLWKGREHGVGIIECQQCHKEIVDEDWYGLDGAMFDLGWRCPICNPKKIDKENNHEE